MRVPNYNSANHRNQSAQLIGFNLGAVCFFECDTGFVLKGESSSKCNLDTEEFGASFFPESPSCIFVPTCEAPGVPVNGRTECRSESLPSGKYSVGSQCDYICNTGFIIDGEETGTGILETECTEYENEVEIFAEFSPKPPTCTQDTSRCKDKDDPNRRVVTCSNGNAVGSTCVFRCSPGYSIFPDDHSHCQEDQTWTPSLPCCLRGCPPQAFMDLIVVLDSSSSIGIENWPIMLEFVTSFIANFDIGEDAARFGLVRYNNEVDIENQILLNDFPDSKSDLLNQISSLPYNGEGTFTGNALNHTRTNLFTEDNGDRKGAPNVVVVVTDGNAQDSPVLFQQADALRAEGATIFAVGIVSPTAGLNFQELARVSGSPNRLIIISDGFAGLTLHGRFARILGRTVCSARSCPV